MGTINNAQVSKLFKDLIDASPELQLRIELIHDGLLLHHRGSPTPLPANVLLNHVLARRRAWENLDPRWIWDEDCPDTESAQFEICDGIWAHSSNHIGDGSFIGLKYRELAPPPSQSQDVTPDDMNMPWEHTIDHLGMNATDFSFNAYHDAQILMESLYDNTVRRMHFRRISTNEVHPDAAAPYFDIFAKDCSVWAGCQTIAYQNRVLMMFSDWNGDLRTSAAMVIDWKLSKAVLEFKPFTPVTDAAFVSSHRILLLHLGDAQHGPYVDLHTLAPDSANRTILCRFHFPSSLQAFNGWFFTHPGSRFGEDQYSNALFGATRPNGRDEEGWKVPVHNHSPVTQAKLFITDPRVEIVGCMLSGGDEDEEIFLALSVGRMVKLYNARARPEDESMGKGEEETDRKMDDLKQDTGCQPTDVGSQEDSKATPESQGTHADDDISQSEPCSQSVIPECSLSFLWDEWGPDSSRCLPSRRIFNAGFRSTAGSRMMVWDVGTTMPRGVNLAVLDFNPLPIRRAEAKKWMKLAISHPQEKAGNIEADTSSTTSRDTGWVEGDTNISGEDAVGPITKPGMNSNQTIQEPNIVITDRLVVRTVTAPTVTHLPGWSTDIETRLPYRIFTLRWDFDLNIVGMNDTTIICRGDSSYQFFSFLPHFDEPEETVPLLGTRPTFLFPLDLVNLQGFTGSNNEELENDWGEDAHEQTAQFAATLIGGQLVDVNVESIGLELLDMDPLQDPAQAHANSSNH
ncbi:hypothetical protein PIIN_01951 [Serendipita indica DSM 11827]|uniref:Uncharacterized protein n=1 Tax=Serendipita indica (strain DSM 11827) TaxID=1109443 RepID=G4T9T0_SERID|nr:hypothetical protein PIIN_01951 [Serendipita indica DSM 11827]